MGNITLIMCLVVKITLIDWLEDYPFWLVDRKDYIYWWAKRKITFIKVLVLEIPLLDRLVVGYSYSLVAGRNYCFCVAGGKDYPYWSGGGKDYPYNGLVVEITFVYHSVG